MAVAVSNSVELRFHIRDDGSLSLLDQAGNKVKELGNITDHFGGRAASNFSKFGASVITVNQALNLLSTAAYAAQRVVGGLIDKVQEVDNIVDTARSIGLTARELSSLRLAATEAGVSLEAIGRTTAFLSKSLVAANDPTSQQARLFRALGVDTKQELLPALIDTIKAIDGIGNSAVRNNTAIVLLGRGSREALKLSGSEIERLIVLNEYLGLGVDENAEAFSRTADAIDEASGALSGLGQQIAENSLPVLTNFAGLISDIAVGLKDIAKNGLGIGNVTGALSALASGGGLNAATAAYNKPPESFYQVDSTKGAPNQLFPGVGTLASVVGGLVPKESVERADQLSRTLSDILTTTKEQAGADTAVKDAQEAATQFAQATLVTKQSTLDVAEANLAVAKQSGATEEEQLAIARQLDDAKIAVLEAEKGVVLAKVETGKHSEAELALAHAQVEALDTQQRLIRESTGEASKLATEFAHVKEQAAQAKQVTLDLGNEIRNSLKDATTGILTRGSAFNVGNVVEDTGKQLVASFVGGLIEAQAKKSEFDLQVSENFTVTLPGFMKTGVDAISSTWSGLMNFLSNSTQNTVGSVGNTFRSSLTNIASTTQSTTTALGGAAAFTSTGGNIGGYAGDQLTGGFTAGDLGGASTIAGGTSAFGGAEGSGLGAFGGGGGGAGGIGALGIAGIIFAAAQAVASVVKGLRSGFQAANKQRYDLDATALSLGGTAFSKDPAGKIWADIFGEEIGGQINYSALTGGIGPLLDVLGIGLFQPKTRGTILARILNREYRDAGLPVQTQFGYGGHVGLRSLGISDSPTYEDVQAFQALGFSGVPQTTVAGTRRRGPYRDTLLGAIAANPDVDALRTNEALGLATLLAPSPRDAPRFANSITNNALLLGLSPEEARRQLRVLADAQGITLLSGLSEINRKYLQGGKTGFRDRPRTPENEAAQQAQASIEGLTKLFSDDLPAGIDVAQLALDNWSEKGGLNIANFQDELEKLIQQFGSLDTILKQGFGEGLTASLAQFTTAQRLISNGGPANEIVKATGNGIRELTSAIEDSVSAGLQSAITIGLQNSLQDTPQWKALQEAVAKAVTGGPTDALPQLISDVVQASLPAIQAAAKTLAEIQKLFAITPAALQQRANALNANAEQRRFGLLNPSQQEAKLRADIARVDTELAKIRSDTIPDVKQANEITKLLEERGTAAQQLADVVANRYDVGSARGRRLEEDAIAEIQNTADQFEEFGIQQQASIDSTARNTTATEKNTEAIDRNTAAMAASGHAPFAGNRAALSDDALRRIQKLQYEPPSDRLGRAPAIPRRPTAADITSARRQLTRH